MIYDKKDVLLRITNFMLEHNYPPNYRELIELTGYRSKQTIFTILRDLRESGYIDFVDGESRTLQIKGLKYRFDV